MSYYGTQNATHLPKATKGRQTDSLLALLPSPACHLLMALSAVLFQHVSRPVSMNHGPGRSPNKKSPQPCCQGSVNSSSRQTADGRRSLLLSTATLATTYNPRVCVCVGSCTQETNPRHDSLWLSLPTRQRQNTPCVAPDTHHGGLASPRPSANANCNTNPCQGARVRGLIRLTRPAY